MKEPEKLNVVIFRENTEDVYAGIEWKAGSPEAEALIEFIHSKFGKDIRRDSAIGIKPMSEFGSKRLVRDGRSRYAHREQPQVGDARAQGQHHEVHRGRLPRLGLRRSREGEFPARRAPRRSSRRPAAASRADCLIVKDRIADAMFQQLLLRPDEYAVIATPNLNGDYISDAAAAQVGGLGIAPGGNVGDGVAVFEATHGTAPKYANLDKINPGSVILSGVMMFEYMGWKRGRPIDRVRAGEARSRASASPTISRARCRAPPR